MRGPADQAHRCEPGNPAIRFEAEKPGRERERKNQQSGGSGDQAALQEHGQQEAAREGHIGRRQEDRIERKDRALLDRWKEERCHQNAAEPNDGDRFEVPLKPGPGQKAQKNVVGDLEHQRPLDSERVCAQSGRHEREGNGVERARCPYGQAEQEAQGRNDQEDGDSKDAVRQESPGASGAHQMRHQIPGDREEDRDAIQSEAPIKDREKTRPSTLLLEVNGGMIKHHRNGCCATQVLDLGLRA